MKKHLLLSLFTLLALTANAQKYVGGDLSLVPAYETAGDQWLDADGNVINTKYSDGMITFMHDVAGWNSVRVRLLADPSQDDMVATCQDLNYVKKLGKRIKDAGMNFLLDIFYSDTWTDVSQQWIPAAWGYDKSTATATLAAKVKSYTTEVLNELVTYGATPDFIQIGNEVSYGMLWDNASGKNKGTNFFSTSGSYSTYSNQITRFATLLKAAAEGVRESKCSKAKIVLHCERTASAIQCKNFYTWVEQAGFTDYDIIGLSYYPLWHQTLTELNATLNTLQTNFPSKEIHIVESGYHNTSITVKTGELDTSSTWAYTPEGQAKFLKDLIATLQKYDHVTGLYYWQPEECGNGADESGNNRVMDSWDKRGFWELTWKSAKHTLISNDALMTMKTFLSSSDDDTQQTDVTDQFSNMDFENGNDTGWTINYDGWSDGPWPMKNDWYSAMANGYALKGWAEHANNLSAGNIIYQSKENMPAGTYTISAVIHTDYDGIYLFANDDTELATVNSEWGTANIISVTTTLATTGKLTFGLKIVTKPTSTAEVNLYADNFKISKLTTGIQESTIKQTTLDNNWYTLNGHQLKSKPTSKGIYINNKKKVIIK